MKKIVIIGAGVGGLATAMWLAGKADVTVLEAHVAPGGKMRTVESDVGPIDAGPTVMTMRPVFEELFKAAGAELSEEVSLTSEETLARHWWPDGTSLDLYADATRSEEAVHQFAGSVARDEFRRFNARTAQLFDAFEGPVMKAPAPKLMSLTSHVLRHPSLINAMAPGKTLSQSLNFAFSDPRLRQLFGRYATYVGGSPCASPAVLALIWNSEARGVWRVNGGMHKLAQAMARVAERQGAHLHLNTPVTRIERQGGRAAIVHTEKRRFRADCVVYAGDPRALTSGLLGGAPAQSVSTKGVSPRSLSAFVWTFAATPKGAELIHHNVFFGDDPKAEFRSLSNGEMPLNGTLYVCAQDRGQGITPDGKERFEIILNGPPRHETEPKPEEMQQCLTETFERLSKMGLTFDPVPDLSALTTPEMFNRLFPGSTGSLYGRSPHGMMAAFQRPTARSKLPGLYLAGGGAHPGAGIPMAALSGQHAAAAIMGDLHLTSTSRKTVTRGGMSTDSPPMAAARSQSSPL